MKYIFDSKFMHGLTRTPEKALVGHIQENHGPESLEKHWSAISIKIMVPGMPGETYYFKS